MTGGVASLNHRLISGIPPGWDHNPQRSSDSPLTLAVPVPSSLLRPTAMNERQIFEAALDIADPVRREVYLSQTCGADTALRARVDALLAAHAAASQFLETPAVQQLNTPPDSSGEDTMQLPPSHAPSADEDDSDTPSGPDISFLSPSTKPGSIGTLGHYEILNVLGQGAFGIVFRAFDEKLHRHVAIKTMSVQMAATSPPRKRFLREARAAAAIRHENVVQVYSVEEQPLPYLVMEFIDGETLQQKQRDHGPLDLPELLHIGRQIAAGLSAAHAQSLIHRDVKPGNILIERGAEQKVKITDFGLARAADDASLTRSGMISGTPLYMAPEQALGQTLDHRSDLFSLGSVLYELATGRPPFRAPNTVAVLRRVVDDTPRPIQEIIPECPDWLVSIINKLLSKQPDDRYQSAKEVADLLARCQLELQLNGQVTCVTTSNPASGAASAPRVPATPANSTGEPVYRTPAEAIFAARTAEYSKLSPAELQKVRSRKRRTVLLLSVLFIAVIMSPYLAEQFRKQFNAWYWPAIPTLPATELATGLNFDGKDDYVEIPVDWSYPQFTIEAFVTSPAQSDNGNIITLFGGDATTVELMGLYDDSQADPGQRKSGAQIVGQPGFANVVAPLGVGVRQHRALVFDGTHMHYYVNGIWQGKRPSAARQAMQWKFSRLRIGSSGDDKKFFEGQIDQVRISKAARYTDNFAPVTSVASDDQTLALYDFAQGSGDILKDISGHGHDGKIIGATWTDRSRSRKTSADPSEDGRSLTTSATNPASGAASAPRVPSIAIDSGGSHPSLAELLTSPGYEWTVPEKLGPQVNSAGHDAFARVSSDGKRMWIQRDNSWAWVSNRETLDQEWKPAIRISNAFQPIGAVADMFVSRDELTWMFATWTEPNNVRIVESNRPSRDASWPTPRPLTETVVATQFPVMTDDGLTLYVSKYFPTLGGTEMCVSTRPDRNAPWSNPIPMSAPVNTTAVERPMWISKDQLTLIFSEQGGPRANSLQYDLFFTIRPSLTEPWQAPVNFGSSINSDAIEASACLSDDGRELIFSRERLGQVGDADLFVSRRVPKKKLSATGWHGWPADAPAPAIAPFDAEQAKQHQDAWAKYLGVPVEYTNSLGMKFRLIPPGEFTMGSTKEVVEEARLWAKPNDAGWLESLQGETPQHQVILTQPSYLAVNETTQADYERVMGINPSAHALMGEYKAQVTGIDTSRHPVEVVNWNGAGEFCLKLSELEKVTPSNFQTDETVLPHNVTSYRLPTEAEWENACRAGTTTRFWSGDKDEVLFQTGWFNANSGGRTHAVGELKANPYGLCDMHGNVWEWVEDWLDPSYYEQCQANLTVNPNGPDSAQYRRVTRGGSVAFHATVSRSAHRGGSTPTSGFPDYGFRVSLSVDAVRQALKLTGPAIPKPAVPISAQANWTNLFDGTTTTGWKTLGPFKIEGGLLKSSERGLAVTENSYDNFELEFEWRLASAGNSGVYYRADASKLGTNPAYPGTEFQLLDGVLHPDGKNPKTSAGALYGVIPPEGTFTRPAGEWNTSRIVARGPQVEHWVNDQKVLSYDMDSEAWRQALTVAKNTDIATNAASRSGCIALQGHTGEIAFRRIRVREISTTAPNAAASKFPPLAPGWFERVSKLPPEEQVKEVSLELKRRNPEWDEKLEHIVDGDHISSVSLDSSHVADITPLSVFTRLYGLTCAGRNHSGQITDLSPLANLKSLVSLSLTFNQITDLTPLRDLPIPYLDLTGNPITDLAPLAGKPIVSLSLAGCTNLVELSPIKGAPLSGLLNIAGSGIRDVTPLRDSKVENVGLMDYQFDPNIVCGWPLKAINFQQTIEKVPREKLLRLKEIKTLETIDGQPVAEFWKEFDAAADKPVE